VDEASGARAAIISYSLWTKRFGSDPAILEKQIVLNGTPFHIVGIAGQDFDFGFQFVSNRRPIAVWTTHTIDQDPIPGSPRPIVNLWEAGYLSMIGTIKPGIKPVDVAADFTAILKGLSHKHPQLFGNKAVEVKSELERQVGSVRPLFTLLFVGTWMVSRSQPCRRENTADARKRSAVPRDCRSRGRCQAEEPEGAQPAIYLPHSQFPFNSMTVYVKRARDPLAIIEPARRILAGLDKDALLKSPALFSDVVANATAVQRVSMLLLSIMSAIALVLCVCGLYGAVAYSTTQRRLEIAIRIALGATPGHIRWRFVVDAALVCAAGLIAGTLGILALHGIWAKVLDEAKPPDSTMLMSVAVIVLGVTLVASYVPARRASHSEVARHLQRD
jgi:hypothetical protein